MRKAVKLQLIQLVDTVLEAHIEVKKKLNAKEYNSVRSILADCQDCAVMVGNTIEQFDNSQAEIISKLESYCEQLFFEIVKFMVQQMADEANENINDLINTDINKKFWIRFFEFFKKGLFDDLRQLQAMCIALKKLKKEEKLNNCLEIHNNIDYEGSELEIK